ncbi:hypothetical protein [Aequorivita sinensis]|uniref:hypothetical protein n=1 Tax=Aequorivita sinensis TaxID=1382458 RepID=UPI002300D630|nr:hypothetical protein [Aequorivita sinensis]
MTNTFQVIYPASENDEYEIIERFKIDAEAMKAIGLNVGTKPLAEATSLMYRGFIINNEESYPKDKRYLNTYNVYRQYQDMSKYYASIADLSIETFFVDDLTIEVEEMIKTRAWEKAFIKKDSKALEHIDQGKSVWPETSFEEMKKLYAQFPFDGRYAIRKYIDPDIIDQEERYWVFNGNIYHRDNNIPNIVKEAAKRLNKLGSRYYTIDATPDFVVEVNPGESSDRHAVNSAELFASWIKKEFVK